MRKWGRRKVSALLIIQASVKFKISDLNGSGSRRYSCQKPTLVKISIITGPKDIRDIKLACIMIAFVFEWCDWGDLNGSKFYGVFISVQGKCEVDPTNESLRSDRRDHM